MKPLKHRALIVEDDDKIVELVHDHLESLGHVYDRAANQTEARDLLSANKYCYILLDLEIPVKPKRMAELTHGINLLEEIRRWPEDGCATQVVIMTCHGRNGPDLAVEMMQKGADDYICKPFGPAGGGRTLPDVIKKALERGCSHAPAHCPVLAKVRTAPAPIKRPMEPEKLTPFQGGKLVFREDRVDLLGYAILTAKARGSWHTLRLLAKKDPQGKRTAYSGDALARKLDPQSQQGQNDVAGYVKYLRRRIADVLRKNGVSCSDQDVIESGGPGYRLNSWIDVEGLDS
ncbi:MAG: response regulator [bacterium]